MRILLLLSYADSISTGILRSIERAIGVGHKSLRREATAPGGRGNSHGDGEKRSGPGCGMRKAETGYREPNQLGKFNGMGNVGIR